MIADKLLTVAQNDQAIAEAAEAIRQAIIAKDVAVPAETPLSQYPAKIAEITQGGDEPEDPDLWPIPSDWIGDIENVDDGEIKLLVTDTTPLCFEVTAKNYSGDATAVSVDWGDGVVEPFAGGKISHVYTTGGVYVDSIGGKMWAVRIWSDNYAISDFRVARYNASQGSVYEPTPIIAMNIAADKMTDYKSIAQNAFSGNYARSTQLNYIKFKYFSPTCTMFASLEPYTPGMPIFRVDLPDTWGNISDASHMFNNCSQLRQLTLPDTWGNISNASYMFNNCSQLRQVTLPASWGSITQAYYFFQGCSQLRQVTLPASWGSIAQASYFFYSCSSLSQVTLPASWGSITQAYYFFYGCSSLRQVTLPASWGSITQASGFFQGCSQLRQVTLPASWGSITLVGNFFTNCSQLRQVTLPASWGSITQASGFFQGCPSLGSIVLPAEVGNITNAQQFLYPSGPYNVNRTEANIDKLGSLTADCNLDLISYNNQTPAAWVMPSRISKLAVTGVSAAYPHGLYSLRLTNAAISAFGGSSPQIDLRYCSLDDAALNLLFSDLPTLSGKTINITGNPGAATCDTTIATSKGWTVTR